ncbi:MAG: LptE family protein [Bacteroidales bacterium]|nr:LptE family protein [Bacteroidales bacterium]
MIKKVNTLLILITAFMMTGCGIYSFTGASIPAEAKTVSVQHFPNNANLVNPMLSDIITNNLRDRFMNQTSLDEVPDNGDLAIEGEIVDYKTSPTAITGDQVAALNRLTITVNVRFYNRFDESKNFEQKFTQYDDYPSNEDLNVVQEALVTTICDKLCEDIFNKAVVNW